MVDRHCEKSQYLSHAEIERECFVSARQLRRWRKELASGSSGSSSSGARKALDEDTVRHAVRTILTFPHLGEKKGTSYLSYFELGLLPHHAYRRIKKLVGRVVSQEASKKQLCGTGSISYEHLTPTAVHDIWAEDFGKITVSGSTFNVSMVIDQKSLYVLGMNVSPRATASFVQKPIEQALQLTGGKGPRLFLLSDNGSQYISTSHEGYLSSHDIVHRLIPSCQPWYNGCMEGAVGEFKKNFFSEWGRRTRGSSASLLLDRVLETAQRTVAIMNRQLPRPSLGGVTPADILANRQEREIARIAQFKERKRKEAPTKPVDNLYRLIREEVKAQNLSDEQLHITRLYFTRKPLRAITNYHKQTVG